MTTKPKTFSLGGRFERFIEAQIELGRYDNGSEVVRAGLRLLEDHEARMSDLRAAIARGDDDIAAGRVTTVTDAQEFTKDVVRRGKKRLNRVS